MIDAYTFGVLTTLVINLCAAVLIVTGFLCIRKARGDKVQPYQRSGSIAMNAQLFDEGQDKSLLETKMNQHHHDTQIKNIKIDADQWEEESNAIVLVKESISDSPFRRADDFEGTVTESNALFQSEIVEEKEE
jgi:hypothetical protein